MKTQLHPHFRQHFMLADKQAITSSPSSVQQKAAIWRQLNTDPFLQKICNIVEERLQDEMSIDDLAKIVYYSRVQVFRKIKSLTGQSPSRFIRAIRLHKALDLLLTTDHKISGIAAAVGFSDSKYFFRVFRMEFGEAPSTIRS